MKIYSAQLKGTTTVATGSNVSLTGSFSGSIAGIDINATNQFTASTSTRLTNIEIISASNINRITSLETKSASVDISISNINAVTSSNIARLSNLETKSSSVDISVSSINSKTGSYATTGSNTFFGTQVFSGSVFIANNLTVQGSSSIQYISASSVSIGTNIVQLNTANPSVRFAGLTMIDSGSVGGSGSFLYDSLQDEFIFVHRGNGTNVTSSHFVTGPETYDSLGNETYLTCNVITKGTGKEHLIDSCIFDNGTTTCIKNNLVIGGTTCFQNNVAITGFLSFNVGASASNFAARDNCDTLIYSNTGKLKFTDVTGTSNYMTISSSGNVGIGISNPVDKFEVVGGIHTSGTASDSKSCTGYLDYYVGQVRLGITGPNTTTPAIFRIDQYSSNASVSRTPFYINANGCVGIGTVTPKMHLTFADGIYQRILLNDNTNNYSIGVANSVAGGDAMIKFIAGCSASGCGEVGFYSSSDLRFLIKKDGDLVSCGTGGFIMTQGTTAQRPTAVTGTMRYNSTFNLMEFYNGTSWVQMGSGDLATGFCFNNLTMCHSVYRASGTLGLQGQGSACISLYGAAAPSMPTSNTGNQFATHGGHCGISDFPGYWAVHLGGARAANQLKVWIHTNSWGYFELQGSNNSGNASGFNQSGTWTTLSFLCSNNSNCQNMGGNTSGCADGTIFTFWYTNDVPFSAYRIKVLDSSRQINALGTYYGGSAGYVWQLNRV